MRTMFFANLALAGLMLACSSFSPAPVAPSPITPSDNASVSTTLTTTANEQEAPLAVAVASQDIEPISQEVALSAPPLEQSIGGVETSVAPVYARPAVTYQQVPIYGRLGRFKGYQTVQVQQRTYQPPQPAYRFYGTCSGPGCGRR